MAGCWRYGEIPSVACSHGGPIARIGREWNPIDRGATYRRPRPLSFMNIGAHVSIAGGYLEAFKRARDIGGNAMQIFTKSPRGGALRKVTTEEAAEIKNWEDRK